ncbi:hypothetical protein HF086_017854 [Spodoptera exigua]|uniref:Uncharacterized protein n=1 Tax=Spodoptera exigua TaxID=7107 RepID=A0A922MRU8_SPOEX|nr:hypothetical protein HF086_017854 [Spodoptera exigua]
MVPNCNNRQLDLVLSGRSAVTVCAADEGLQPVDAYHPPLAVGVAATSAQCALTHSTPAAPESQPHLKSQSQSQYKKWNFRKADYSKLYNLINLID